MGEDRKLIEWEKTVSYFEALDRASDGIVVRKLGKTTGGRDFIRRVDLLARKPEEAGPVS